MTNIYSIITAGGIGSGLWPLSRETSPKHFFKFNDDYTLFQRTFLNLAEFVDDKKIITVTNMKHTPVIKKQLNALGKKFERKSEYKVISEPEVRNTAAAVAVAAKYIANNLKFVDRDTVIVSVPSDSYISDRVDFAECVMKGCEFAKAGYIVAYGTLTKEIDENFGYIKAMRNKKLNEIAPEGLKISKFIEKPDTKAKKSAFKGRFFVNSGVYMFTPETLFGELKKCAPEIYKAIADVNPSNSLPSVEMSVYEKLPAISFDRAISEKTKKAVMIEMPDIRKDLGSWSAIYDISQKDSDGNVISGNVININSENSIIYSQGRLAAVIGVKDKAITVTDDAVAVTDIKNPGSIKKIYAKLNGKNEKTKESHKTVYRPWGCYTVLENGGDFLTKCIIVNPGAELSLQLHNHRSEHWVVLEGEATVLKGDETLQLLPGESVDIAIREVHSLQNHSEIQLKILEIQQGDILDENDIERLKDMYGRA